MKDYRVIQVSFDVIVDCDCDGTILAENLAEELEDVGYEVVGAGFQADVTESYKQQNQGFEVNYDEFKRAFRQERTQTC